VRAAEIVRPPPETDIASFGTTVTLRRNDGRERAFRIVGEDEADPSQGTVSYVSPLARAVMTCRAGDTVEIAGGKAEILEVR
jgi:transcription elongation GreA/GreB family factor